MTVVTTCLLFQNICTGVPHGAGRITISKSSNIHEHHRGHRKRYNSDLSPIYENIAYLDLEHRHRQTAANHDRVRNSKETEHDDIQFQSSKDRGRNQQGVKRRHSDFPINKRRSGHHSNHSHRQHGTRQNATPDTLQLEEVNTSRPKAKDSSRLKQQSSSSEDPSSGSVDHSCKSKDRKSRENGNMNEHIVADRNVSINNKRRLHHTHSDPTNDKTRSKPKKIDYVGYNVIENFLKESEFDSDQMVQKTFRSNSEPLVHVPRRLKHALFIDAYEDKSKSLEDIISNTTDNVPVKVKDGVSNSKHNSKQGETHFKPIEAYKDDTNICTSNPQPLDDQVPTTSKGLTKSSLYQGHPTLDPTLLHPQLSEYPSNPGNNRRVKLTPLEQRQARSWCPAERKIKKRCFLIFFIILVLGVTTFVLFVIKGWDPVVLLTGKPHPVPIPRESNTSSEA